MNAALGGESAGGIGTPELDVTHNGGGPCAFVATQPGGSAGGVTPSKFSAKCHSGSNQADTIGGLGAGTAAEISTRPQPVHIVWRSRSAALGRRNKMRRVIHSRSAPIDVVAEVWPRTPQQCHGASDMRGRHGRAAKTHVSVIGGVIAGTSACARRGDIRFDSVTPIDRHRAAAAKGSDVVGAGVQRADRVRCRVDSRRIHYSGTVGTVVARSCHHHYPSGGLSFDSSLQRVSRTTF